MKFDMTQPAPTRDDLAAAYREADAVLTRIRQRKRLHVATLIALTLAILILIGIFNGLDGIAVEKATLAVAVVVFAAVAVAVAEVAAGAEVAVGVVAEVAAGVAAVAEVAAVAGAVFAAVAGAEVAAVVGAVVVFMAGSTINRWIMAPREQAQETLSALVELNASTHPDACIDLGAWAAADDAIRAYLAQVAAMGRMPVMGEYQASKAWMAQRCPRQSKQAKLEQARAACSTLFAAAGGKDL